MSPAFTSCCVNVSPTLIVALPFMSTPSVGSFVTVYTTSLESDVSSPTLSVPLVMGTVCLSFKTRSKFEPISSFGGGGGGGGGGFGGGELGAGGGGGEPNITASQSNVDEGGGGAYVAALRATTISVPLGVMSEPPSSDSITNLRPLSSSSSCMPMSITMYMLHRSTQSHDFTVSVTFVKDAVY